MGEISALLPILQGGMQAASSYEEGQASKMVSNINARYAQAQGREALRIGEQDAGRRMMQGGQEAASETAHVAAQGIRTDTGSAAAVHEDIKNAAIMDAQSIRTNAAKQAWGYGVEASNFRTQGRFAEIKGYGDAAQSIIGGGLRYAYDQYRFGYKTPPPDNGPVPTPYGGSK